MKKTIPQDIFLFVFAVVMRVLFWTGGQDSDYLFSIFYYGDSVRFHLDALDILNTHWHSTTLPYHPPVMSHLLALFYQLFGTPPEHLIALKLFLILVSSLQIPVFHHLARRFLRPAPALVAAILYAASFPMLVTSITPNAESIFLLLCMLTFITFYSLTSTRSVRDSVLIGVFAGLASLTRAEFASFFFLLMAGMAWQLRKAPGTGKALVVAAIAFVVVLVPWTIRNYGVITNYNQNISNPGMEPLSPFVTISDYGPLNFAMANNHLSDGKFNRDILAEAQQPTLQLNNPQHRYYFLHGYKAGFDFIRSDIPGFIGLAFRKLGLMMESFSYGFTPYNLPGSLNGLRYPIDIFVSDAKFFMIFTIPLFLAGAYLARKEFRVVWPLYLLFLHRLLITALFFGYLRGMVAIYFVVILFCVYPFRNKGSDNPNAWKVGSLALILAAISTIPLFHPVRFEASGPSDGHYLIQDTEIKLWTK